MAALVLFDTNILIARYRCKSTGENARFFPRVGAQGGASPVAGYGQMSQPAFHMSMTPIDWTGEPKALDQGILDGYNGGNSGQIGYEERMHVIRCTRFFILSCNFEIQPNSMMLA